MTVSKPRRVLRLPQVIEKTGLGRDTVYRGGREGCPDLAKIPGSYEPEIV